MRMEVRWSNLGSTRSSLLQQISPESANDVAAGPWCLHTSEDDSDRHHVSTEQNKVTAAESSAACRA